METPLLFNQHYITFRSQAHRHRDFDSHSPHLYFHAPVTIYERQNIRETTNEVSSKWGCDRLSEVPFSRFHLLKL
jgi:hypothetical protein